MYNCRGIWKNLPWKTVVPNNGYWLGVRYSPLVRQPDALLSETHF